MNNEKELANSRITYIDIAKGLGIILIIIGHSLKTGWLREYIYSFHVPFFFFISGLTYKCIPDKKAFYLKKFKTIVVPYLFAGLLSIIVFSILGRFASARLGSEIGSTDILPNLLGMLYGNSKTGYMRWNLPLWFLPCLFCITVLVDAFETKFKDSERVLFYRIAFVVCTTLTGYILTQRFENVWLPWHLETGLNMAVFFELGIMCRQHLYDFVERQNIGYKGIFIPVVLILSGVVLTAINRGASVREDNYHTYALYLINALLSGRGYFAICVRIKTSKIVEYIGQNTLPIVLYHKFPILFFQTLVPEISDWLKSPDTALGIIAAIITVSVSLALCLVWGNILKKAIPWSVGIQKH